MTVSLLLSTASGAGSKPTSAPSSDLWSSFRAWRPASSSANGRLVNEAGVRLETPGVLDRRMPKPSNRTLGSLALCPDAEDLVPAWDDVARRSLAAGGALLSMSMRSPWKGFRGASPEWGTAGSGRNLKAPPGRATKPCCGLACTPTAGILLIAGDLSGSTRPLSPPPRWGGFWAPGPSMRVCFTRLSRWGRFRFYPGVGSGAGTVKPAWSRS